MMLRVYFLRCVFRTAFVLLVGGLALHVPSVFGLSILPLSPEERGPRLFDFNSNGLVVGFAPDYESTAGYYLRGYSLVDGQMQDLGALNGQGSVATAINSAGQIVGASEMGSANPGVYPPPVHAVVWQNGEITDLGTLAGGSQSLANDINDQGQIVGWSESPIQSSDGTTKMVRHAVLWQNGQITDLGTVAGYWSEALAISNSGQIVGRIFTADGLATHAVVWENGVIRKLDPNAIESTAYDVNDAGQVVGYALIPTDSGYPVRHAVVWTDDQRSDLGTLGGDFSTAYSINNSGMIVGESDVKYFHTRAFVYENGAMTELDFPGDMTTQAWRILDDGRILGSAEVLVTYQASELHPLVWQNGQATDLTPNGPNGPFTIPAGYYSTPCCLPFAMPVFSLLIGACFLLRKN